MPVTVTSSGWFISKSFCDLLHNFTIITFSPMAAITVNGQYQLTPCHITYTIDPYQGVIQIGQSNKG